jgi:hypothetical protein
VKGTYRGDAGRDELDVPLVRVPPACFGFATFIQHETPFEALVVMYVDRDDPHT